MWLVVIRLVTGFSLTTNMKTLEFIIRIRPWSDSFEYSYNDLRHFSYFEPEVLSGHMDEEDDGDYVCSELATLVVNDYMCLQLANCEEYVLGVKSFDIPASIFPTTESVDKFYEMVFGEIKNKFNKDFRENYDKKNHAFLFEIYYDVSDNDVNLIESKITDTIENE